MRLLLLGRNLLAISAEYLKFLSISIKSECHATEKPQEQLVYASLTRWNGPPHLALLRCLYPFLLLYLQYMQSVESQ